MKTSCTATTLIAIAIMISGALRQTNLAFMAKLSVNILHIITSKFRELLG
jgi:hypothetical protein